MNRKRITSIFLASAVITSMLCAAPVSAEEPVTVTGVFGEEEYLNNAGEVKTANKLFWFRGIDKVMDAEVPAKRTVEKPASTFPTDADGFMNIPDGIDEELPFN